MHTLAKNNSGEEHKTYQGLVGDNSLDLVLVLALGLGVVGIDDLDVLGGRLGVARSAPRD